VKLPRAPWLRLAKAPPPIDSHDALTSCPAPWEPIDPELDASYRELVEHQGPALVDEALQRPDARSWLLVRYLSEVPDVLVEWSLSAFRREAAGFCELAGGAPDFAAADAWEAEWRAGRSRKAPRRRAAS